MIKICVFQIWAPITRLGRKLFPSALQIEKKYTSTPFNEKYKVVCASSYSCSAKNSPCPLSRIGEIFIFNHILWYYHTAQNLESYGMIVLGTRSLFSAARNILLRFQASSTKASSKGSFLNAGPTRQMKNAMTDEQNCVQKSIRSLWPRFDGKLEYVNHILVTSLPENRISVIILWWHRWQ